MPSFGTVYGGYAIQIGRRARYWWFPASPKIRKPRKSVIQNRPFEGWPVKCSNLLSDLCKFGSRAIECSERKGFYAEFVDCTNVAHTCDNRSCSILARWWRWSGSRGEARSFGGRIAGGALSPSRPLEQRGSSGERTHFASVEQFIGECGAFPRSRPQRRGLGARVAEVPPEESERSSSGAMIGT